MTLEEKLNMYREKKQFIENLGYAFQVRPGCASVEGVDYEVYTKQFSDRLSETRELVIVHYVGGGKAMKIVSGNSNAANFVVIGSMLQGGCYEQVRMYEEQVEQGYKKVDL
jgi:hypothetical protein